MSHPNRPTGPNYDLPECEIKIGTKVHPAIIFSCPLNGKYYRRKILRHELSQARRIINKLRRDGYSEWNGKRLPDYNKNKIRQIMHVMDNAYEAEICGITPVSIHVGNYVSNQCYVGGVVGAASGIEYRCRLLFRAIDEYGNHVAYMPEQDFSYGNSVRMATYFS